MDPTWLGKAVVLAVHGRLLAEHGGASGMVFNHPFVVGVFSPSGGSREVLKISKVLSGNCRRKLRSARP